ncbi:MAG TPA: class I SAM-dependent methyltransferase [Solirubrobacteraceae bacterium]
MVHHAAATGFARSAEAYERARPDYPPEAIAYLARELDLGPGRVVVDLAAGTGKLARPLARLGCEVIAVEPVDEMRAAIGNTARALAGTAEAIPVGDDSADGVTVGQAFHWFDGRAALAEIERVLRPGGGLALVWNRRPVESSPLQAAIAEIIAPYRVSVPAHGSGAWREAFAGRELSEWTFAFEQHMEVDRLVDRVASMSFIAALDEPERRGVLDRVRGLVDEGPVAVPYVCEIYLWRPS